MFALILASALDLLAPPRFSDPTLMSVYAASNTTDIATVYFSDDRAPNFTAIAWLRWNPNGRSQPVSNPCLDCLVTPDAGRATREGGAALPDLQSHRYEVPLTLSNGTWAETCLPDNYLVPVDGGGITVGERWRYGCYCYNVETDSDLVINVGGAERNISAAAGVKQIGNILATTASRAVSISAASASATVRFGIAENPLCQFVGGHSDFTGGDGTFNNMGDDSRGGISSNEWRMCCFQGVVSNGYITTSMRMFNSLGLCGDHTDVSTQTLLRPHTTFAKDARLRFCVSSLGGIMGVSNRDGDPQHYGEHPSEIFAVYGLRVYRGWLDDALIDRMRAQDYDELARRGWL